MIAILVMLISDRNTAKRMYASIPKYEWDISATDQTCQSLISKANLVVSQQIQHESETFIGVSQARGGRYSRIRNASEFRAILENYPKLTSDQSVMKLLNQIEESEKMLLQQRKMYSMSVANYNAKINQFPLSLFKKTFGLLDADLMKQTATAEQEDAKNGTL